MSLFRVQDKHGRGPWRPGLSSRWVDAFRTAQHPPIYEERPDWLDVCREAQASGAHVGCAVDGADALLSWFSPMELIRLHDLGFFIVDASACDVLIRTQTQVVIASRLPLKKLPPAIGRAAPTPRARARYASG